jgi:hypothetical protein
VVKQWNAQLLTAILPSDYWMSNRFLFGEISGSHCCERVDVGLVCCGV